jgi:hypothetical protein
MARCSCYGKKSISECNTTVINMDDNEKEVVSKFLDLSKFAILAILVGAGIIGNQFLL